MASSTRQALSSAREEVKAYLSGGLDFATDLFAMAEAISTNAGLRGVLSDPSTDSQAKSALVDRVWAGKVSAGALEFLKSFVAKRFSTGSDLVSGLEQLGVHAAAASNANNLEVIISELFAFEQVVASDRELQFALSSKSAKLEAKLALVQALVGNRVSQASHVLIVQAVRGARGRKVGAVLDQFAKQVAAYGQSLIANVRVANQLSDDQLKRLSEKLAKTYGESVKLNVELDPNILGGIVVEVAGEIIDGSVANRLNNLKKQLVHAAASVNRS